MAHSFSSVYFHRDWRAICLTRPQFTESSDIKVVCAILLTISVSIGVTDVLVFFIGCHVHFIAHPGCMALGCMAGPCFVKYSLINRTILFSLTFLCALIYAVLICFCETKRERKKRIVEVCSFFHTCKPVRNSLKTQDYELKNIPKCRSQQVLCL
ncbi:hypothetical protein CRE_19338 [Caenorhabditis remanei]|uniref:Uncharacterized protein n=1 Tax=Caenorhabditis remanei TaxID=31234 RepID=E3N526_CAERE|nr:hypothetical protein CRE_19338 [Caenorhabditis remanei]